MRRSPVPQLTDRSNGYESVAAAFLAGRGNPLSAAVAIGVRAVDAWARQLPEHASVLDLGCGAGVPLSLILVNRGLSVYAIDAAPTLLAAFRLRYPHIPAVCESVEESPFFGRRFDAVLAWGLLFLLRPAAQRAVIRRIAAALRPKGRFLFTAPPRRFVWDDAMTGLKSRSLGALEYRRQLSAVGLRVVHEYDDEGENHYYDTIKGG